MHAPARPGSPRRKWAGRSDSRSGCRGRGAPRRFVFAAAPDGRIHKLRVASGAEVRSGGWPVQITRLRSREKIGPALNYAHGLVLETTGGYVGDAPPYQGHVVAVTPR